MAHGLEERNGRIEAAFAGQVPWHGLGMQTQQRMAPMEALTLAGIDWEVKKFPTFFQSGPDNRLTQVPENFATVRTDTMEPLGSVGPLYTVLQNREQAEFIEALVGKGAVVECVGALFGGKRIFWTVKSPADMIVKDDRYEDRVKKYLILYNSHDGSGSFRAFWNPVRVVCNNTLKIALGNTSDGVCIRHTRSIKARMSEAERLLGMAKQFYENAQITFDAMAAKELDRRDFTQYLDAVFGSEVDEEGKPVKKVQEIKSEVAANLEAEQHATGKQNVTLWDAWNAITFKTSHAMSSRKTRRLQKDGERKFDSVLFGAGDKLRKKSFTAALSVLSN